MRDAFGGVFTINYMLVFIFIFIAFTAVSLNYAKAFKLKNDIIDFIEENEIRNLNDINNNIEKLDLILARAKYNKPEHCGSQGNGQRKNTENEIIGYCYNGVYISIPTGGRQDIQNTDMESIQYKVTTYADWDLGALNKLLALGGEKQNSKESITGAWKITGDAKVIARKN